MARISTYVKDQFINFNDLLVGSEFGGIGANGRRLYTTKNYRIGDLADFFGLTAESINTRLDTYLGIYNDDGSFTYSTAFATQSLGVISTAGYASAYFVTNLGAIVGTLDEDGRLVQLSEAFANQVLSATSSTKFASTLFATNLASSFGSWNPDGSISVLSSSFADSVFSTMNTSSLASASYVNNLSSSLGSFNPDGTLASLSESFADTVFSTMNTSTLASASSVTNLSAALSLKPSITRATTAPSIQQEVENELGAVTIPQSPPNGSMWIDISTTAVTDSNGVVTQEPKNEMYVLAGAAGSAAWTLTKDASLLNTVTSLATAEQSLTTVSNAQSATATFATGLASNFGTVNATTGVFTDAAGVANQILNTSSNNLFAKSSFVTNLVSTFGTTDVDGNLTINAAFADSVLSTQTSGTLATAASVTSLGTAISDETSARQSAITTTQESVTDEASARASADTALSASITAEGVTRAAAFTSNQTAISNEATARATADTALSASITAEGSTRASAVTTLNTAITDEASTRASAITNVQSNITAEGVTRSAAVTTLTNTIATVDGKLGASYALTVGAGNAIAGMKLLSNGTTSTVSFSSDQFNIYTSGGNVRPFAVSGNTVVMSNVVITGSLSGVTGDFTGNISGSTGTIGGWTIGTSKFESSDNKLTLDSESNSITFSDSNSIPRIQITSNTNVANPAATTAINASTASGTAQSITQTGAGSQVSYSNQYVSYSVGSFQNQTITFTGTINPGNVTISGAGPGQVAATWYYRIFTTTSTSSSVLATSGSINYTNTSSTAVVGSTTVGNETKTVSITVPSGISTVYIRAACSISLSGTSSSATVANATWYSGYPVGSFTIQKVEISQGGLLVAKDSDGYFRLDRNATNNTYLTPFIKSRGYFAHSGQFILTVDTSNEYGIRNLVPAVTVAGFFSWNNTSVSNTDGTPYHLYCEQKISGTQRLVFSVGKNGDTRNLNLAYNAISDVKLKENIIDATPKLNDLLKVRIRQYNLIGDDLKQIGVIAQELEGVFPGLIGDTNDLMSDENGNMVDLGTTTKEVKYSVFIPMLIKAIQEQQVIIKSQEVLMGNLITRIEALEV